MLSLPMYRSLVILLLLCFSWCLHAQKKPKRPKYPFNAGFVLGFNVSQLDGDYQFGYHKYGLSGGLRGIAYLTPSLSLGMELLYSQRGSQPSGRKSTQRIVDLELNYAETPFILYILTSRQQDGLPKVQLQLGMSFARLLNYRITEYPILPQTSLVIPTNRSSFFEIAERFDHNDLSIIGGVIFHFGSHVNLSIRHAVSTNLLYDREKFPEKTDRSIRSFFFSLHAGYRLLHPYGNKRR